MRTETERWLRYAREDLVTVQAMLAAARWAPASFHAQQAAEKALKALYIDRAGRESPRTHDLVRLGQDVQLPKEWEGEVEALSRAYLVSRYPDESASDDSPFGRDRSNEYLEMAERIVAWVEKKLSTG